MARTLVLAILIWHSGCASGAQTSTRPDAPRAAAPARSASPGAAASPAWWCISFRNGEVGSCFRKPLACTVALADLRITATRPDEGISDCAPQRIAICVDTEKVRGGEREMLCHPTFAICRSHVDHIRSTRSAELRVVSECARVAAAPGEPPGADAPGADQDEAAHWWCLSMGHDRIGSCDRSRPRCEASRSYALRIRPSPSYEVTDCAPQRSALCFDTQDSSTNEIHSWCHPTIGTCQSSIDQEHRNPKPNVTVVSSCRPMD